jgi:hypothetical protein
VHASGYPLPGSATPTPRQPLTPGAVRPRRAQRRDARERRRLVVAALTRRDQAPPSQGVDGILLVGIGGFAGDRQPLRPAVETPAMKVFCAKKKRTMMGRLISSEPPMSSGQVAAQVLEGCCKLMARV